MLCHLGRGIPQLLVKRIWIISGNIMVLRKMWFRTEMECLLVNTLPIFTTTVELCDP